MSENISSAIRRARINQGLSQSELATKLGVSQPLVSNWENGNLRPDYSMLVRLESIFGRIASDASTEQVPDAPEIEAPSSGAYGAWLTKARANRGMSVPELAKAAGISAVAIYNIESGRSLNPQPDTRARLERALNAEIPTDVQKEAATDQDIRGVGTLTDFDPHNDALLPEAPGVYVFYDISERPIYVGKSDRIARRVREHADKFWFRSPIVYTAAYVEIQNADMRHSVEQVLIKFLKSNAVINSQSVTR
jgi:transcriptional regulator with XRE-family HTH domain